MNVKLYNFVSISFSQLDPNLLHLDEKKKNYVQLLVQFGSYKMERIIPLSSRAGYIFIQTDKPVYNPGDICNLSHVVFLCNFITNKQCFCLFESHVFLSL